MEKQHVWPQGHWAWPIDVTHKHGVRCGDMFWVGGQVDLDASGVVQNPYDLHTQTENAVVHFQTVLNHLGADLDDLVKLLVFYVNDGSVDEEFFLGHLADQLPPGTCTAVTAIPIPCLAYPGLAVEIEGIAMRAPDGAKMPRTYANHAGETPLPGGFAQAVRCGRMIFVSGQSALNPDGSIAAPGKIVEQTDLEMGRIGALLAQFGAGFEDVVKNNRWYSGGGTVADFEPAALACAAHYAEPGPAATGIPIPRHARDGLEIKLEVVAMLGEDGTHLPRRHVWPETLWDWHVHLPYKHGLKCGNMIYLGGQVSLNTKGEAVHPNDLKAQTHQAMQHIGTILKELGADYGDVCKVLTLYEGEAAYDTLHNNLGIRSSYFPDPGPATTGVPLPVLAYPNMVIEIDIMAMVEED